MAYTFDKDDDRYGLGQVIKIGAPEYRYTIMRIMFLVAIDVVMSRSRSLHCTSTLERIIYLKITRKGPARPLGRGARESSSIDCVTITQSMVEVS